MKLILIIGLLLVGFICEAQETPAEKQTDKNSDSISFLMIAIGSLAGAVSILAMYVKSLHSKQLKSSVSFAEAAIKMSEVYETSTDKISAALDRNTVTILDLHKLIIERINKQ